MGTKDKLTGTWPEIEGAIFAWPLINANTR